MRSPNFTRTALRFGGRRRLVSSPKPRAARLVVDRASSLSGTRVHTTESLGPENPMLLLGDLGEATIGHPYWPYLFFFAKDAKESDWCSPTLRALHETLSPTQFWVKLAR